MSKVVTLWAFDADLDAGVVEIRTLKRSVEHRWEGPASTGPPMISKWCAGYVNCRPIACRNRILRSDQLG